MPFTETITITRTGAGAATHTSTNPPLAGYSTDGYVTITWGDTAAAITQNFKDTLQTKYVVSGCKGYVLFVPNDLLTGSSSAFIYLSMRLWEESEDPIEIILSINNGGATGNLAAGEQLGRLYFLQPLKYNKPNFTFL